MMKAHLYCVWTAKSIDYYHFQKALDVPAQVEHIVHLHAWYFFLERKVVECFLDVTTASNTSR